ncbi:toll/interleukin-1 receptor domain-containing protein [Geodermatophilus sp. URMC 62]|uniref:toll/interleukin-1 receptor domain-containing protein n=1 Tax=Geodermatophilus sp. URMC 62 TaxID=3423414 RepID=UPI00406C8EEE
MSHNLFISHKHSDARIAQVLADFVESRTLGQVSVHMSSDPRYKGPRLGKNLNEELGEALYSCDVLLLVYTSADEDWSYCMFECGVATDPRSPRTNIIVFQCGADIPAPFADQLRVNVRDLKDLRKFTKAFFTDRDFFPKAEAAFAPNFPDDRCDEAARELYDALASPGILPPLEAMPVEDIHAWPLLRLDVALPEIESIAHSVDPGALEACRRLLLEQALISYSSSRAPILFGLESLPPNMPFGDLLAAGGGAAAREESPPWVNACAVQVLRVARRRLTSMRWESFQEVDGDAVYTPIVTRMRRVPADGRAQFDIYAFELANPHCVAVAQRMIDISSVYLKHLDASTRNTRLRDLRNEMHENDRERLPILSEEEWPLHLVHRSMLERYMLDHELRGESLDKLTLGAFLEQARTDYLAETFATLAPTASLADAQRAMAGPVRDVFVTVDGSPESPVLGWLSNVQLTQYL